MKKSAHTMNSIRGSRSCPVQNGERTKSISVTKTALHKSFAFLGLTKVLFGGSLGIGGRGDREQQFGDWED